MRIIFEFLRKLFKKTTKGNSDQKVESASCAEPLQKTDRDDLRPMEIEEPPLSERPPDIKTFHMKKEDILSENSSLQSSTRLIDPPLNQPLDDRHYCASSHVSQNPFVPISEQKGNLPLGAEDTKRAAEIGQKGERISNYAALPIATYGKQLRNLYIPSKPGSYTEIDTLIISVSGLYVLETKHYRGWIYGDEDWKMWTVTYSKQKKYTFYNPIKQNATHIWALKKLLPNIRSDCYFSFVVFSDDSEFKKLDYYSPRTYVMKHGELNAFFRAFQKENEGLITREMVNQLFQKLKPYCDVSESVKQQHIADVNSKRFSSNNRYS